MRKIIPLLSLLCVVGWQAKATAHGVTLKYQTTQAYEINAAYDTGEPMTNAQVAVFAPDNPAKPWLTGTTDEQGRFSFSPTTPGNWEVQVRQAGHGEILVVPVEDAITRASNQNSTNGDTANPSAIASASDGYSPLQKSLMIGSVIWGCVGTALFFSRGKKG